MPRTEPSARERNIIEHMLQYCNQVEEALQEINGDKERFLESHTYQNAIAMCILQLGELTKQLSLDFVNQHPEIPWRVMARTRDNYAHHYGSMDFSLVWETAVQDVPAVRDFCGRLLEIS